jgi:hypothetical protein
MDMKGVTQTMQKARKDMSAQSYLQAGSTLNENKNAVREEIQSRTAEKVKSIIHKLTSKQPLSSEEGDLVRLWIVGDAESYTKMENNFQDWLKEFDRLEKEINVYEEKDRTADDLFKLQGILEDAVRITYDISNYLEKKERLKKYELALIDGLDDAEREVLVNVLTAKLKSEKL